MIAVKLIIRVCFELFRAVIVGVITYIGARIGERVMVYSHYMITTHNQRKRRIPIGFARPS